MVEFTLAGIAVTAMTEGIKFLYGQASELIKSWRERRRAKAEPVPGGVFAGEPRLAEPNLAVLESREGTVEELLAAPELVRVVHGREADPGDAGLVRAAETLRAVLEEIYGERLTFQGERDREPSGTPLVRGTAEAEVVKGLLAGVKVGTVRSGEVTGASKAGTVESTGVSAGVVIDELG